MKTHIWMISLKERKRKNAKKEKIKKKEKGSILCSNAFRLSFFLSFVSIGKEKPSFHGVSNPMWFLYDHYQWQS